MPTSFALQARHVRVSFAITGYEPGGDDDGLTWLAATVSVRLDRTLPLSFEGPCSLTTDDLASLSAVLDRLSRPAVGAAGRLAEWMTRDEEVELTFAWQGEEGTVSARVDTGTGGGHAAIDVEEAAMTREDLARTSAELAEARRRLTPRA